MGIPQPVPGLFFRVYYRAFRSEWVKLWVFATLFLITSSTFSQTPDEVHYFYEPHPMGENVNVVNLGISFSLLPAPIVEQEIPAPAIDFQFKHGFSDRVSFYGSLSTNVFTNVLAAGLQYNIGDKDLSFSVGDAFVGFAGFFNLGGEFDNNTAAAVANIPVIRIGHRFGAVAMSLSMYASYVIYADTHVGSLEDKRAIRSKVNDIYATLAFEQPFFGKTSISTGISVTYSRTPYQIWMLYNVFDQYLVIPEFFFSFHL
jgi:hypothetical protein